MRYVDWRRPARQHPNLIIDATEAQQSGALFARKFDLEVPHLNSVKVDGPLPRQPCILAQPSPISRPVYEHLRCFQVSWDIV